MKVILTLSALLIIQLQANRLLQQTSWEDGCALILCGYGQSCCEGKDGGTACCAPTSTSTVWINEVHYDDKSYDDNEFVEVAGLAGVDASNYRILLYNGATGTPGVLYGDDALTGTFANQENGIGFIDIQYPLNGIQNGGKDGIALVYNDGTTDHVVQFLSYEGVVTANEGPAQGLSSTNIGAEYSYTMENTSLSLQGTGKSYDDFTWDNGIEATPGAVNTGQTITCNQYDYTNDGKSRTRDAAQAYCESRGSNLATIVTDNDLVAAVESIDSYPTWFQLSSQDNEIGQFSYPEDGTQCPKVNNGRFSGACLKKKWWVNNKPLSCDEENVSKCVRILPSGLINNDVACERQLERVLCNCVNEVVTIEGAPLVNGPIPDDNDGFWHEMFNNSFGDPMFQVILTVGVILFILINNVFLCYWCLCGSKKPKGKYEFVSDKDAVNV